MKKRSRIALLTALLTIVFAAGIGVYSNYIGMQIYQESSNHLLESYAQISKTFTLFVQRNWVVLSQWDSLMKNVQEDADIDSIWLDAQSNKLSWHYSDLYLFNESTQYLTADGRKGSADSINGVFQEMYSKGEPIVSTYTATYGVPKIVFAMPMSRNLTLDGVTYTGIAVSYDTDVVDDLVDGSMYGGQSDCYVVRSNGDIVLKLEPQTELCEGMTNLYDLSDHATGNMAAWTISRTASNSARAEARSSSALGQETIWSRFRPHFRTGRSSASSRRMRWTARCMACRIPRSSCSVHSVFSLSSSWCWRWGWRAGCALRTRKWSG